MADIYVFTAELELLGIVSDFESLTFTHNFNSVGDFTISLSDDLDQDNLLELNNVIMINNDTDRVGIINHIEYSIDDENNYIKTIKGNTLGCVLSQRVIYPDGEYDYSIGTVEEVLKHYVRKNLVDPVDKDRAIKFMTITQNKDIGNVIKWQSRFSDLGEEVVKISTENDIGWKVHIDLKEKEWVFDVYEGVNRSVNQTEVSPVIFSDQFNNLKTQFYIETDVDNKNFAYIGGAGEGVEQNIYRSGNTTGLDRKEIFVEVDEKEENEENEKEEYIDPIELGEQKLAEYKHTSSLDGEVFGSEYTLGVDYNLGDIVTIMDQKWNMQQDKRIMSVTEVYDDISYSVDITFGEDPVNLSTKIKRDFSRFEPFNR